MKAESDILLINTILQSSCVLRSFLILSHNGISQTESVSFDSFQYCRRHKPNTNIVLVWALSYKKIVPHKAYFLQYMRTNIAVGAPQLSISRVIWQDLPRDPYPLWQQISQQRTLKIQFCFRIIVRIELLFNMIHRLFP